MSDHVSSGLHRILAWADAHVPGLRQTLQPGAGDAVIRAIETTVGAAMPDDVRALYRSDQASA